MLIDALLDSCLGLWDSIQTLTAPVAWLLEQNYEIPVIPILGITIPTDVTVLDMAFGAGLPVFIAYQILKSLLPI